MRYARAGECVLTSAGLETLEARVLMDGVSAAVTDAYTTATKLVMVVKYTSDQPVDAATLGDRDIALLGPGQFFRFGQLVERLPLTTGEVLGVYHFAAAFEQWRPGPDDGQYSARLLAGAVADQGGDLNAPATLRDFNLWFNNARVVVVGEQIPLLGQGLGPSVVDNYDGAVFNFAYHTREGAIPSLLVRLTGPNGFDVFFSTEPSFINFTGSAMAVQHVGARFKAPGGAWDYTDNGAYTMTVTLPTGPGNPTPEVVLRREYQVQSSAPRAQVVQTLNAGREVLVTMRYDAPGGMNLSSIGDSDIGIVYGGTTYLSDAMSLPPFGLNEIVGSLAGAPVQNADGSVTAMYHASLPDVRAAIWGGLFVRVREDQVFASNGQPVGTGPLAPVPLEVFRPDIRSTTTVAQSRASWTVEVVFNNPGGLIDLTSIRSQNLIVSAPGGRATRVGLVSVVQSSDGSLRVQYRVIPGAGMLRLASGMYTLALASDSVQRGPIGPIPGQDLGGFDMTF
jgi:hypothetical protein